MDTSRYHLARSQAVNCYDQLQTWNLALRIMEEHKLTVFKRRVLRKTMCPKGGKKRKIRNCL